MKISGMETQLLKSYMEAEQKRVTPASGTTSYAESLYESLTYSREAYHLDLELTDGSSMSIDIVYEAMQKKTAYEFSAYADYTYANDYYSPENTSKRILDFAENLWDGSAKRLEMLVGAISEGISQARDILGELPEGIDSLITRTEELIAEGIERLRADIPTQEA